MMQAFLYGPPLSDTLMTKKKNEERSPWSTETAESTINSLSGLDTSVSLLTQAPLVDYRNLPRLALVRDGYSP